MTVYGVNDREGTIRLLRKHEAELRARGVRQLWLFGSVARGDGDELSDLDVIVDFGDGVGLFEWGGLQVWLERTLGRKVDVVTPNALKPRIRDRVWRDAVLVLPVASPTP
jgi:hypothetical protein